MKPNNTTYKNSGLSREDIENYQSSKNEKFKHSIEKKVLQSDFDTDALDGWSSGVTSMNSLKKLDEKWNKKLNFKIIVSVTFLSLIILFFLLEYSNELSPKKSLRINPKNEISAKLIHQTDIVIPSHIRDLNVISSENLITSKKLSKEYKLIQENKEIDQSQFSKEENISMKKLDKYELQNGTNDKNIFSNQFHAKEIYFNDLKLVDYREYRSKSIIKSKQLIISGTSADRENPFLNGSENDWEIIEVPYIDYIKDITKLFSEGNYKTALSRFELILKTYPNDINANFYAGLCYYNLKNSLKAIEKLNICIVSEFSNFNEETEWYLAKSYQQNGNIDKANELFNSIKLKGGYYSKFN